jgi:hypothetical protein
MHQFLDRPSWLIQVGRGVSDDVQRAWWGREKLEVVRFLDRIYV